MAGGWGMGREILQPTKIPTSLQAPPSPKSAPAPKLTPPPSEAQRGPAVNGSQCPTPAFHGLEPLGPLGQEVPYCHLSPSERELWGREGVASPGGYFLFHEGTKKAGPLRA